MIPNKCPDTLTCAIIGHLVGDYILQNDWMALNKKRDSNICSVHCTIWTLCVSCFSGWICLQNFQGSFIGLILFVTHFVQDHTNVVTRYMDWFGQNYFRTGPCSPWSTIVVDNVFHILTIWFIWRFIT